MVDQRDLLAFELVQAAFLLADGLHQRIGRQPVGAGQREVPLEHGAVLAFAAAVACRDQRNLVARRLFGQGEGDTGRQGLKHGGATVLALQSLVAFDTARSVIACFAFFIENLDAIDAALGIHQLEVIGIAVGPGHAIGRKGAGPVRQSRKELLLGLGIGHRANRCHQRCQCKGSEFHACLLKVWH